MNTNNEDKITVHYEMKLTPETESVIKNLYGWIQETMYAEEVVQPTPEQLQNAFDFVYAAFNGMSPEALVDRITDH